MLQKLRNDSKRFYTYRTDDRHRNYRYSGRHRDSELYLLPQQSILQRG